MRKDIQDLWTLAEPYVRDAGFDLVEVQSGRETTGWVIRLFIDCPVEGQTPVSHADCERVSRDISVALDVADLISHARIKLAEGVEGRRNFSGTIRGAQEGFVEIECEGRSYKLSVEQVAKANLIPDWKREFHRSAS